MPRYFFNTRDGVAYDDPEGLDLPDLECAGAEALRYMSDLMRDRGQDIWRSGELELSIADEDGAELCRLMLLKGETCSPYDLGERPRPSGAKPGTR